MPPKKKPTYASPAAAKAGGQAVLSRFFPVKSKRGGQKKKSSNAGRPPARPGGRGGDTSLTAERGRQPRASGEEKKKAVAIVDTEGGWASQVNSTSAPACPALFLKSRSGVLVCG